MLILYLYKKEKKPFIGCWQEPHIISSQRVSSDSTGSNSSPQKFGDKLWLGFTKRDGSCAYWPSWRWAYWWQGEAWDGLDIVLSMSSRLARRWQTLITPSQFVKQEERLRWGWGGDWSGVQRWKGSQRVSEVGGDIVLCDAASARTRDGPCQRRLDCTAPVWTCLFIRAPTLEIKSVWQFMFLLFMSSASAHFIGFGPPPPPFLHPPPRAHFTTPPSFLRCHLSLSHTAPRVLIVPSSVSANR